ncbi:dihydroorotase [Trueperella bernardiae]|uniref:dihydroorotase n=1 Tax=Trueperella bernardiae TaxID=59561 RepID=UPI0029499468|nr:dihydroorotase [Trueperella bernardiae]MDV6238965.1 dihydroorotase [Trueperella bernardiae]
MRKILQGARVVDPQVGLDAVADIYVRDGRIVAIVVDVDGPANAEGSDAAGASDAAAAVGVVGEWAEVERVDLRGKVVLPGLFDMHVHFREPGQEHKEDILTGSRAAARGGFTGVATMANTTPVVDNGKLIERQIERGEEVGLVDIFPIGAVTKGLEGKELAEMGEMAEAGAVAFSDDGHGIQHGGLMRLALDYAKVWDRPIITHSQDDAVVGSGVVNEGVVSTRLGLAGWPAQGEVVQILRDVELVRLTGGRMHVAHISTAPGVEVVREAKAAGLDVTAEATPHHLFLTEDDITTEYETYLKVNPPLRAHADAEALAQAVVDGTIDVIATDHAPHAAHEKDLEFENAPFGMIGLETSLPAVFTGLVQPGRIGWDRVVELMVARPREILRLAPQKIEAGTEANLCVFDPEGTTPVDREHLASKSANSGFWGRVLHGEVWGTMLRGEFTYREGAVAK